jgi:serine/threonine-protein kinase
MLGEQAMWAGIKSTENLEVRQQTTDRLQADEPTVTRQTTQALNHTVQIKACTRPSKGVRHPEIGQAVASKNGLIYTIESVLGRGGMGIVYAARRDSDQALVALKVPLSEDPEYFGLFRRETAFLSRLNHPRIVRVYDHDETVDGYPYLAMELIEGRTLADILDSEGHLSAQRAVSICQQIADGMHYAHENGVVHCDLKPANIVISNIDGREAVCILDFGISEAANDDSSPEEEKEKRGSLLYMAPEQIKHQASTSQSDIYQLALILIECLTGELPFEKGLRTAVLYRATGPLIPDKIARELPGGLRPSLEKALSRVASERHATMKSFADHVLGSVYQRQRAA